MQYKIKYSEDADVLTIIVRTEGELSHAKAMGDFIVHFDKNDEPLFLEILKASKIVPMMLRAWLRKNSPLPKSQRLVGVDFNKN